MEEYLKTLVGKTIFIRDFFYDHRNGSAHIYFSLCVPGTREVLEREISFDGGMDPVYVYISPEIKGES